MNNLARFGSYLVLEGTGRVLYLRRIVGQYIGVGRFRILGGGQGLEYWGGGQIPSRHMTS